MGKTVIGVFNDLTAALNATPDLVRVGIPQAHISTVAQNKTGKCAPYSHTTGDRHTGDESNAMLAGVSNPRTSLAASAIPGMAPLVATGPLATAISGTPNGTVISGLAGALTGMGVPESEARAYEAGLREGQSLIIISTTDAMAVQVMEILRSHRAVHISMRSPRPVTAQSPVFFSPSSY